jgi:hypothetical protein
MKFMLIALNILLAAGICHLAWITVSDPVALETKTPSVSRAGIDKKSKPTNQAGRTVLKEDPPSVVAEKIAALNAKNIFDVERVPEAPASKAAAARANNQQIRLGMSLVGTYSIGDSLGAIILQRLQGNSQQLLKELQQKEYEQFLASSTRITDPKKKAQSESESSDDESDEVREAIRRITMNPSVSGSNVIRQRLKVGDTTLNGYTLVEVTRTSATLTKGKETVELPLLTPSEASNQARQNNNRNANNNNNRNNQQANNNNNNNNANRNNQQANNNNNRNNNNNNRNNNNNNRNNNNNANRNNNNNRDDSGIIWF